MRKNGKKSRIKVYKKDVTPYGGKSASFYILDVLIGAMVKNAPPLCTQSIRQQMYRNTGYIYTIDAIHTAINCLANMDHLSLNVTTKKIGDSAVKHFSIKINTDNHA